MKVLIADDHPLFREALGTLVSRTSDMELVGAVETFEEAMGAVAAEPAITLVLLDLDMPGMNGLSGVRRLREAHAATRVAIVSGTLAPSVIREALAAGASGYIPKTLEPDLIVAALRLMLAGAVYIPSDALDDTRPPASRDGFEHDTRGPHPAQRGSPAALTPRELEVLHLLVGGAGNKEIARAIGVAEVTVKLHTRHILDKLRVRNRAAAAAVAVSQGLLTEIRRTAS
jgi:DNA-binding NarL/FixJ family response regulator